MKIPNSVRRITRALLALLILVWLARSVGFDLIREQLTHANLMMLAAATGLLALDGVAKARNWQQLLKASVHDAPVRFRRVLNWFFAGGFVGAIVPSSAGTDACRVWMAIRGLGGHGATCAASILTVNCLGWFTGSVIGLIGAGLLAYHDALPNLLKPAILIFVFTLATLPLAYATLAAKRGWTEQLIERISRRLPRVKAGVAKFLDALLVFELAHVRMPVFLFVSAAGLLAQTGMFALTAKAVGLELPFAVWMVLVPLTRLVALIPVSIADFGLIQAAHVSVLALFGVPASQSFALSALFAVEGLLIHSTLGSTAFLLGGRKSAPPAGFSSPHSAGEDRFSLDEPKSVR